MRRSLALIAALLLAAVVPPVMGAATKVPRVTAPSQPGPGYVATDNVTWLGNIPLDADSAGARVVGKHLYVTQDRGLTIYDISDPELPVPVGAMPLPQQAYFTEEDVDTNGRILLVGTFGDLTDGVGPINTLNVVDVSNPALPKVIGTLPGADSHTVSCVLDCTWAYDSNGMVVDLRVPTAPKLAGKWTDAPAVKATGVKGSHDVTEVSPGMVVTSSNPVLLLELGTDPVNPKVVATGKPGMPGKPGDNRFIHGNLWPRSATDRFLLAGGETSGSCNTTTAGAFMVFDTTKARPTDGSKGTFTMTDEYRIGTGAPTDGKSPYDQYCAHWFTEHPTFKDGGLVAAGWYEHGTRFFNVSSEGKIAEAGWFLPFGGSTSAAYWVSDTVLYAVDYQRGIDILRFDRTKPPTTSVQVGVRPASIRRAAPRVEGRVTPDTPYICPVPGRLLP